MQEEIFGPILPMIEHETLDEVIHKVQEKAKPLALYLLQKVKMCKNIITESSFIWRRLYKRYAYAYRYAIFTVWRSGRKRHGSISWKRQLSDIYSF